MSDVDEFIEGFLQHNRDPASVKEYNRQYYLRTRKLKGRRKTQVQTKPKRVEEDEVPEKSPTGAKLVDFDGKGGGRATYADGSVFDGNGWNSTGASPKLRMNVAQLKLDRAKRQVSKIKDPTFKKQQLQRIVALQKSLNTAKSRQARRAGNRGTA